MSECYVALLRGINVGKNSRVAMADLRELMGALGYTNVQTLLQSGNVIFDSEKAMDASRRAAIEAAILERAGVRSRVVVLTESEFRAIDAANPLVPFADEDPSKMVITFLDDDLDEASVERPTDRELLPERLALARRALYQWCPNGILKSRLSPGFWRQLGPVATTRNARTVERIIAALDAR